MILTGASQNDAFRGNQHLGGTVFGYNETVVRLWTVHRGNFGNKEHIHTQVHILKHTKCHKLSERRNEKMAYLLTYLKSVFREQLLTRP